MPTKMSKMASLFVAAVLVFVANVSAQTAPAGNATAENATAPATVSNATDVAASTNETAPGTPTNTTAGILELPPGWTNYTCKGTDNSQCPDKCECQNGLCSGLHCPCDLKYPDTCFKDKYVCGATKYCVLIGKDPTPLPAQSVGASPTPGTGAPALTPGKKGPNSFITGLIVVVVLVIVAGGVGFALMKRRRSRSPIPPVAEGEYQF